MAHSYISNYVHYVFSTVGRQKLITPDLEERLWPFLAGIARQNKMKAVSVGGTQDHIHMLVSLPSTLSMAKGVQLIKGGSSKWIHDTFPEYRKFNWQEGYGGFSIRVSQVQTTVEYIQNQKEHHKKKDFKEEFLSFLKKHKIEYDPRYIWD